MMKPALPLRLTRRSLVGGLFSVLASRLAIASPHVTPPQTPGPFYPLAKPLDSDADLSLIKGANGPAKGDVIEVSGRVLSARKGPLPDSLVELWQADSRGYYNHPREPRRAERDANFQGYGAVRTGPDGVFRFRTIKPRYYDTGFGLRTPHIHFRVVTKGALTLATQMYFPDEPMNQSDMIFSTLPSDTHRKAATAEEKPGAPATYVFDIVLA